jgi:hypothetical protein
MQINIYVACIIFNTNCVGLEISHRQRKCNWLCRLCILPYDFCALQHDDDWFDHTVTPLLFLNTILYINYHSVT